MLQMRCHLQSSVIPWRQFAMLSGSFVIGSFVTAVHCCTYNRGDSTYNNQSMVYKNWNNTTLTLLAGILQVNLVSKFQPWFSVFNHRHYELPHWTGQNSSHSHSFIATIHSGLLFMSPLSSLSFIDIHTVLDPITVVCMLNMSKPPLTTKLTGSIPVILWAVFLFLSISINPHIHLILLISFMFTFIKSELFS